MEKKKTMFDLFNFFKTEPKMENGGAVAMPDTRTRAASLMEQMEKENPPKNGFWNEGENEQPPSKNSSGFWMEKEFFKANQDKLKAKYGTGVAVIKNRHLIGVWQDRQTALKEGFDILGYVDMFVKNINEGDSVVLSKY